MAPEAFLQHVKDEINKDGGEAFIHLAQVLGEGGVTAALVVNADAGKITTHTANTDPADNMIVETSIRPRDYDPWLGVGAHSVPIAAADDLAPLGPLSGELQQGIAAAGELRMGLRRDEDDAYQATLAGVPAKHTAIDYWVDAPHEETQ